MIVRAFSLCLGGAGGPSEAGQPALHSCPVTHITCTVVCVYRRDEGRREREWMNDSLGTRATSPHLG